jgi:predicted Zn finger-like uncharacterized protein
MRFSCEGCNAKYMISDDKVGSGGVKVRCKKCGHVTHVRRGEAESAAGQGGIAGAEWWVAIDEQPVGPVGIDVVQHHWNQGEIGPESLVWYSGLPEWAPISSVPELHGHLGGGMPVAPPPSAPPAPFSPPVPDDEWRPGAASALAALDEPEQRSAPVPDPFPPAESALPEEAPPTPPPPESPVVGTDPTDVVPLPMAGLERTGENRISSRSGPRGPRPGREMPPPRESRSLSTVLLVALVVVAVVAAGLWWMTK